MTRTILMTTFVAAAASLAGCAADGGLDLMTGSIGDPSTQAVVAKAPAIDPACIELTAKIDQLRKEGTPDRLAKVAEGKSKTASVKRDALARMSELDKANQEFQAKCSTLGATPAQSAAAPATTAQQVASAAQTAATAAQNAKTAAQTAQTAAQTAQTAATIAAATAN